MAWRDGVVQGSFRGVPFLFEQAGGDHGRRLVKHEFPNRDTGEGEDLGRKSRSFSLDVFILAADFPTYKSAKNALIGAFEQAGPGPLVHPTLGTMTVYGEGCKWSESTDEQGRCNFQLTFWDPGSTSFTAGALTPSQPALVDTASLALQTAALSSFLANFTTLGFLGAVMSSILNQISTLAAVFNQVTGLIALANSLANSAGIVSGQAAAVSAWNAQLVLFAAAPPTILSTPATLAAEIQALIAGLPYLAASNTAVPILTWADIRQTGPLGGQNPVTGYSQQTITSILAALEAIASLGLAAEAALDGAALAAMTAALLSQIVLRPVPGATASALAGVSPIAVAGMTPIAARQVASVSTATSRAEASPVAGVTPSRVQMAINQVALVDLVRQSALAQAAQAVASSSYSTVAAAQSAMNDIASRLDLEMQLTADNKVYQALAALRVSVVQAVNATIANLPLISTITLPRPVPALVLAYRLYDDPGQADAIVALNDVPHPGFLPAGTPLQIQVSNA